ncbi:hypothetical protein Lesp02_03970 [Lentzea sp. NBRC 105346]|uniref:DUF6221 family protein n=1 Tax=Lentzea sp. NBRC 105346 TaxID=3032205 RepID=UPI0024A56D94|nr:DUF6221 family protein [Lentzea sp. NBRC 105346]GLZ28207.1 hypothetical protein Lesp02_03970 [Lentzea sp. NBRC 105346]
MSNDPVTWLREQIADTEQAALPNLYAPDDVQRTARDALAQCEAHTAILDFIERNTKPDVQLGAAAGEAFIAELYLSLNMHELLGHLALAYQHRPGYAETIAALNEATARVTLTLSDKAKDDELAARRLKRQDER